jgi:hypothetical protein
MQAAREAMRANPVDGETGKPIKAPETKPPEKPAETKPPETKPPEQKAEEKPPEKPATTEKPAEQPPAKPGEKPTTSPWKLLDGFKSRVATLEAENLELKNRLSAAAEADKIAERAKAAEARATELEQEIAYVNYAKSQEFQEKYQKPYEDAWKKAVAELAELEVTGEDGSTRKASAEDLLALANMPLGQARKLANQLFGEAADDVMAHRRRIRDLSDAQGKALEEAKTKGLERQKQTFESAKTLQAEVTKLWQQVNAEDASKYDFLKPKEGDDEWNAKLEKAKSLVDRAFGESATDPKLTAEQRAEVIRRHAAVRNRAIAYSALKLENTRLKAQLAEKEKALGEFQASVPGNGEGKGRAPANPQGGNPMDAAKAALRKSAVPAPSGYL